MTLGLMDLAFVGGLAGGSAYDADALAYITAVEAADTAAGQSGGLETGVKDAINAFFVGCKADGTLPAIKAACILAGAKTRQGALVPLLATMPAPTSFNFVNGDYDRKLGLVGDGSTKYLDSNRANDADPQNDKHLAIYKSVAPTIVTSSYIASQISSPVASSSRISDNSDITIFSVNSSSPANSSYTSQQLGFLGASRLDSSNISYRASTTTATVPSSSNFHININTFVFARNLSGSPSQPTNARLAFYSIGKALDLALLDARVTALINALAVAI